MNSIHIKSKERISLDKIKSRLSNFDNLEQTETGGIAVDSGADHAYLEYEDETRTSLFIDYTSVSFAKRILLEIADTPIFTVDDGFETTLRGDEFVALIRNNPQWDWKEEYRVKNTINR